MQPSLKHRLEYLALSGLKTLANTLPESTARNFGANLGRLIGRLWSARRQIACDNLAQAFPDRPRQEIEDIAGAVFANVGRTMFEVLRFGQSRPEDILARVDTNGTEPFEEAARLGRGALLVSAHIGNWEIHGAWIRALGYPVDVVVKPMRNPLADHLLNSCRAVHDVGIIHTQQATSGIVRAVKQRRFVAIVADQYAGGEGVGVEFFGRTVSTPRGPAALALKYGCPIITGYLVRKPDGRYYAFNDTLLTFTPSGDSEKDVVAVTQAFTTRIENYIRRKPDEWLWTHRRWGGR
ncbi:MAG TPA: lysophospholipid acyltransferase family protein [Acidobacteriota bacterium]|nr:lysophospholipid acyltransferase family protein [Acidobacteriota bacterium]